MFPEEKEKDKEDDFEFEVEDGEPIEDEDRVPDKPEKPEEDSEDQIFSVDDDEDEDLDEKQKFGKRAQKRIRKLVQGRRELETQLVAAKQLNSQLEQDLSAQKGEVQEHQGFAIQQYEDRLEAEGDALEKAFLTAQEEGDPKVIFDINRKLARVEAGRMDLEKWQKAEERKKNTSDEDIDQRPREEPQQIRHPKPDKRATAWAKGNVWFGKDEEMTVDALEIHRELVVDEGVDPEDDGYYAELDKRIREIHPDKFKRSQAQSNVAGASRGPGKRRTKIKLSANEKARAERMGIPLERYAREKAALAARNA